MTVMFIAIIDQAWLKIWTLVCIIYSIDENHFNDDSMNNILIASFRTWPGNSWKWFTSWKVIKKQHPRKYYTGVSCMQRKLASDIAVTRGRWWGFGMTVLNISMFFNISTDYSSSLVHFFLQSVLSPKFFQRPTTKIQISFPVTLGFSQSWIAVEKQENSEREDD